MIAGYDHKGPSIYMVNDDGMRCKVPDFVSVGSGSLSAYAIMDSRYKEEMTDEEAFKLAKDAIMHSTYRDSGSGGLNNSKIFDDFLFYKFSFFKALKL
jgi:20S proteasome subunit beta 5